MVCVICKLDHNIINNIICLSKLEKLIIKYNKYNKIQHMENFFQKKYYCDIENRNQIKKHKCYDCYKEFNNNTYVVKISIF